MSLMRFRKQADSDIPPESAEAKAAREAVNDSLSAARQMIATKEFAAFKAELAKSVDRTIDLLIQIDEQEVDSEKFSVRVRNVLHKVKFLKVMEVIVETKAGGSQDGK